MLHYGGVIMIKLKLFVRKVKAKENEFNSYSTVTKDGKKLSVKFVRTCKDIPEKSCVIYVNEDQCNYANAAYPTIWVKSIEKIEELPNKVVEMFENV